MALKKPFARPLSIGGAFLLSPSEFNDGRGSFYKAYDSDTMRSIGNAPEFCEEYFSVSKKNVLRGFHYQLGKHAQAKLIRCSHGEIYAVIVDLRKSSSACGKWEGVSLSEKNRLSLYAPRGTAIAFLAKKNGATVVHLADNDYAPSAEAGIIWNDPSLKVKWGVAAPILSEKDLRLPRFKDAKLFD